MRRDIRGSTTYVGRRLSSDLDDLFTTRRFPDMPARDTSKADTTPDDGEPTTSTSATDASTTQGAAAAGVTSPTPTPSSAGGAATAQQGASADPVRVQIEQAPDEPAVQYPGDPNATDPDRPHVKAEYKPFVW